MGRAVLGAGQGGGGAPARALLRRGLAAVLPAEPVEHAE